MPHKYHPFVATPDNGNCSSCGKPRNHRDHREPPPEPPCPTLQPRLISVRGIAGEGPDVGLVLYSDDALGGTMTFPSRWYNTSDIISVLHEDATEFAAHYLAFDRCHDDLAVAEGDLRRFRNSHPSDHDHAVFSLMVRELSTRIRFLQDRCASLHKAMHKSLPPKIWRQLPDYVRNDTR